MIDGLIDGLASQVSFFPTEEGFLGMSKVITPLFISRVQRFYSYYCSMDFFPFHLSDVFFRDNNLIVETLEQDQLLMFISPVQDNASSFPRRNGYRKRIKEGKKNISTQDPWHLPLHRGRQIRTVRFQSRSFGPALSGSYSVYLGS